MAMPSQIYKAFFVFSTVSSADVSSLLSAATCAGNSLQQCGSDSVALMQTYMHHSLAVRSKQKSLAHGKQGWDVDVSRYSNTMTLTALVGNGMQGTLGAFVGGEVRGVQATPTVVPFGPYANQPMYQITIYADAGGETVTFEFESSGIVTPLEEDVVFEVNGNTGSLTDPFKFTLSPAIAPSPAPAPEPSWEVDVGRYSNTMTLTALVGDGMQGTLGAFVGGEVRGVQATPTVVPFGPHANQPMYQITIYADAGGETVTFEFESNGIVTPLEEDVVFLVNGNTGSLTDPFKFTLSPATTPGPAPPAPPASAPAPPAPAPAPAPVCADRPADEVAAWAQSAGYGPGRTCAQGRQYGICQSNPEGMGEYCAATCDLCPSPAPTPEPAAAPFAPTPAPTPAPVCADRPADEVAAWAQSAGYGPGRTCAQGRQFGVCQANPDGMREYCAATCGFCP